MFLILRAFPSAISLNSCYSAMTALTKFVPFNLRHLLAPTLYVPSCLWVHW